MYLISHKGAAGLAHENSWEAIQAAKQYNPRYIEIDVHRTSDGVFVLYHGEIKQTYTGKNMPASYDKLKKAVPTLLKLEELLKKDDHSHAFMFDIKCGNAVGDLITFFHTYSLPEGSAFTTPHERALIALKKAFPGALTLISQPYQTGPIRPIELARDRGFDGISLNKWWLSPLPYFMCKYYKKQIMVYTIDHKIWIRWAQRFYPYAMICTNYPQYYDSAESKQK